MEQSYRQPIMPGPYSGKVQYFIRFIGGTTTIAAFFTVALGVLVTATPEIAQGLGWSLEAKETLIIALAFWAVVPPFWYWIEFMFIFRWFGDIEGLETLKYAQRISGAIWAGLLVFLGFLLSAVTA